MRCGARVPLAPASRSGLPAHRSRTIRVDVAVADLRPARVSAGRRGVRRPDRAAPAPCSTADAAFDLPRAGPAARSKALPRGAARGPAPAATPSYEVVRTARPVVVPDTALDPAFRHLAPQLRAYAAVPLVGRDVLPLRALCVLHPASVACQPRSWCDTCNGPRASRPSRWSSCARLDLRRHGVCRTGPTPAACGRPLEAGQPCRGYQPVVDLVDPPTARRRGAGALRGPRARRPGSRRLPERGRAQRAWSSRSSVRSWPSSGLGTVAARPAGLPRSGPSTLRRAARPAGLTQEVLRVPRRQRPAPRTAPPGAAQRRRPWTPGRCAGRCRPCATCACRSGRRRLRQRPVRARPAARARRSSRSSWTSSHASGLPDDARALSRGAQHPGAGARARRRGGAEGRSWPRPRSGPPCQPPTTRTPRASCSAAQCPAADLAAVLAGSTVDQRHPTCPAAHRRQGIRADRRPEGVTRTA